MSCFSGCGNRRQLMQPVKTVKALLDTVVDSCCKFDEIHKDIVIPISALPGLCDLAPGDTLPVMINGPICCKEVKREQVISAGPVAGVNTCPGCALVKACLSGNNCAFDPCTCLSTVLCMYPVEISDPDEPEESLCQTFTSLHTVELDCTDNSQLDCQNSKCLTIAAVVTSVDPEYVVVTVIIGARMCLRQVEVQEHCLNVGVSVTHRCNPADLLGANCSTCTGAAEDLISPLPIPEKNCRCDCKTQRGR